MQRLQGTWAHHPLHEVLEGGWSVAEAEWCEEGAAISLITVSCKATLSLVLPGVARLKVLAVLLAVPGLVGSSSSINGHSPHWWSWVCIEKGKGQGHWLSGAASGHEARESSSTTGGPWSALKFNSSVHPSIIC